MAGGPLAVVQNGDFIELDAYAGKLHLEVSDEELKQRLENLAPPAPPSFIGGYRKLYVEHVLQADEGCDFDFWSVAVAQKFHVIPINIYS